MAIFYTGPRPVTKGRNSNDEVHPWKGTAATYSNYSIYNTSHVLDGAPNTDHVPGEGRHPHDLQMSKWSSDGNATAPISNVGGGARLEGFRYRPLEYKGTDGQAVFQSDFGHEQGRVNGYSTYSNFEYDGVPTEPLADPGHTARSEGGAATFGAFAPYVNKGVTVTPLNDPGESIPTDYDHPYGKNKVAEWRGVPSSKALNV